MQKSEDLCGPGFVPFFSYLFPINNFQRNAQDMRLQEIVG